jgi:hypothetical protein
MVDTGSDLDLSSGDDDKSTHTTSNESDNPKTFKKARTLPNITTHINIETPPWTSRLKATIDSCGPFFFNLETTHNHFIEILAKTVQPTATKASINQSKFTWKQNVPANDKQKHFAILYSYCNTSLLVNHSTCTLHV